MDKGSPIPVWFSAEDRRRVEEAAALAGYRHLSKYVRDRTLGRGDGATPFPLPAPGRHPAAWGVDADATGLLADLDGRQRILVAMGAMLLFLMRSRATTGEANELVAACQRAQCIEDVLGDAFPQLAAALARLVDRS